MDIKDCILSDGEVAVFDIQKLYEFWRWLRQQPQRMSFIEVRFHRNSDTCILHFYSCGGLFRQISRGDGLLIIEKLGLTANGAVESHTSFKGGIFYKQI